MRSLLLAVVIVPVAIVVLEVLPAISQDNDPPEALRESQFVHPELRELQKRRLDSVLKDRRTKLRQLVETVTEDYRRGKVGYDLLARAMDKLIEAEIELTESAETRIELRQRHIELRRTISEVVEWAYQKGRASEADRMFTDADYLDAVVQVEREKARSIGLVP